MTGGRKDEGRLAKLGAGLIQPFCRRDGTATGSKLEKRLLAGAELLSGGSRVPAVRLYLRYIYLLYLR
jgi:hypothetical protein